jgi:hypothetical protein
MPKGTNEYYGDEDEIAKRMTHDMNQTLMTRRASNDEDLPSFNGRI